MAKKKIDTYPVRFHLFCRTKSSDHKNFIWVICNFIIVLVFRRIFLLCMQYFHVDKCECVSAFVFASVPLCMYIRKSYNFSTTLKFAPHFIGIRSSNEIHNVDVIELSIYYKDNLNENLFELSSMREGRMFTLITKN